MTEETQETWVTVAEAATALGVSDEAIRQRLKRRSLRSRKGNDGRLRVLLPIQEARITTQEAWVAVTQEPHVTTPEALVATLRERLTAVGQRFTEAEAHYAKRLADKDAEIARQRADYQAESERQRTDHQAELIRLAAVHAAEIGRLQQVIDRFLAPWWRRWFGG